MAAFVVGLLAEKGWDRKFWPTVLAMVIGNIIIYAFGLAWLALSTWLAIRTGPKVALATGLYPFIRGDMLKIVLAAALLPSAWKLIRRSAPADPKI